MKARVSTSQHYRMRALAKRIEREIGKARAIGTNESAANHYRALIAALGAAQAAAEDAAWELLPDEGDDESDGDEPAPEARS